MALRVALVLENYARRGDGITTVGIARLASDLGMSRRTVRRGLVELEQRGHLEREHGRGEEGNGGRTARTRLIARKVGTTVVPWVGTQIDQGRDDRRPQGRDDRRPPNPSLTLEPAAPPANEGARGAEQTRAQLLVDWIARGFSLETIRRGCAGVTDAQIEAARAEVERSRPAQRALPLLAQVADGSSSGLSNTHRTRARGRE